MDNSNKAHSPAINTSANKKIAANTAAIASTVTTTDTSTATNTTAVSIVTTADTATTTDTETNTSATATTQKAEALNNKKNKQYACDFERIQHSKEEAIRNYKSFKNSKKNSIFAKLFPNQYRKKLADLKLAIKRADDNQKNLLFSFLDDFEI